MNNSCKTAELISTPLSEKHTNQSSNCSHFLDESPQCVNKTMQQVPFPPASHNLDTNLLSSMMDSVIRGYQETITTIMNKFDSIQNVHSNHLIQQQNMFITQLNQQNEMYHQQIEQQMNQHKYFTEKLYETNDKLTQITPIIQCRNNANSCHNTPQPINKITDVQPNSANETANPPASTTNHNNIDTTPQNDNVATKSKKKKKNKQQGNQENTANQPQQQPQLQSKLSEKSATHKQPQEPHHHSKLPEQPVTPSCSKPSPAPATKNTPSHHTERAKPTIPTMVIGDSIVKNVKGGRIRRNCGKYTKICSFPGAIVEKIADHTEVELEWASPEVAILHAGVNDLLNKVKDEEIVDNRAYLVAEMMNRGVKKIAISSLTPKYGSRDMINNCNKLLKDMSLAYGYDYIDNSNISTGIWQMMVYI